VSFLYYADRLIQFPLGLFGVAVSTAALPGLSALAAAGRRREFVSTLNQTVRLSLFLSIPAAAGLSALAVPVVALLFQRGEFGPDAVRATAQALWGYAPGLPAFALVRPLVSAFYARRNTRAPVWAACCGLLVFAALALALMGPLGHAGLALATSASAWANALALCVLLGRAMGPWQAFWGAAGLGALLSAAMGLGVWGTWLWLGAWSLALIPAWAVLYVAVARALGMDEARVLGGLLTRAR
jgi:putative peptidoglycan lipid II flippase